MSHFLLVPVNENGVIVDPNITTILQDAMTAPFAFSDVFIYSHGWWTDATRAMSEYNLFTLEFARLVERLARATPRPLPDLPTSSLGIGIHWPSMLSEDQGSIANFFEGLSFYTMEKRADAVGDHSGYTLCRLLLQGNPGIRIHCLGHSFGSKVVCSGLQSLFSDTTIKGITAQAKIDVVLLQAAFDNDDLEPDEIYGDLAAHPGFRLLVTTSQLDAALNTAYPAAHLVNFFKGQAARQALGAAGPSQKVQNAFGGQKAIAVAPGFTSGAVPAPTNRLVVADLTPLHQASKTLADKFSGHHSDIFLPEIYQLIAGFLFQ